MQAERLVERFYDSVHIGCCILYNNKIIHICFVYPTTHLFHQPESIFHVLLQGCIYPKCICPLGYINNGVEKQDRFLQAL